MLSPRFLTETLATVDWLPPASRAAGVVPGAWVPLSNHRRLLFELFVGVMGASGTLDLKLQVRKGTGTEVDIPGAALAQIVKATGDNTIHKLEFDVERITGDYDQVRFVAAPGTSASIFGVHVVSGGFRFGPADEIDSPDVAQIVRFV